MSEKLHPGAEFNHDGEAQAAKEQAEKLDRKAEQQEEEHGDSESISRIQKQIEAQAISSERAAPSVESETISLGSASVGRDLKQLTFNRTLVRVRKHLTAPDKALSKFIHSPFVDRLSEATGKTVARPSGFLGGGLVALAGTSVLLYLTKKYGYEFNYLAFLLLFVSGFVAGLLIELLIKLLLRKKHSD